VLGALVSTRRGWFDRFVVNPVARLAIVPLVRRAIPVAAVLAGALLLAAAALFALWADRPVLGLVVMIVAGIGASLAGLLADLRDEPRSIRVAQWIARLGPALAVLVAGVRATELSADRGAIVLALALLIAGILVERARTRSTPSWWATPPSYLPILLVGTVVASPAIGLAGAGLYAAATLAAAIERFREQP
jgi:hypothetical protein